MAHSPKPTPAPEVNELDPGPAPCRPLAITTSTVTVDEHGNVCPPISVTRLTAGDFCTDIYPSEIDATVRQLHSVSLRTHTENQRRTPFVTYPQVR